MKKTPPQLAASVIGMLVAAIVTFSYFNNTATVGELSLWLRASWLNIAVLALFVAAYPFTRLSGNRSNGFALGLCFALVLPAYFYFLVLLPAQAEEGIEVGPLELSLITDRSSNGIVEIGFSYPIFTPRLTLSNKGLYTRRVQIFFRVTDPGEQPSLYRAVRASIPDSGLSVEATVRGMLSENEDYLFNPLTLPPGHSISGRMVFIITGVESGYSFSDSLRAARSAQLEIRDLEGALISSLAVSGL